MNEGMKSDLTCGRCKATVADADKYCTHCGALFSEGITCSRHRSAEAEGGCVICSKPFCKKCGSMSNGVFLCEPHWHHEIQEGMARVFGCYDNVQAQQVTSRLQQAGYHAFLYSRMFNPGAGAFGTMVKAGIRNFGNHPIVELKVLVPFPEVLSAEKTLRELGIHER